MAAADEVDGTEITFWHSMGGVNGQAIDELVKRFNEENELGITVVSEYQGEYDDALNKLKSAQIEIWEQILYRFMRSVPDL